MAILLYQWLAIFIYSYTQSGSTLLRCRDNNSKCLL